MRTDRRKRMLRHAPHLIPVHDQITAHLPEIDTVTFTRLTDPLPLHMFRHRLQRGRQGSPGLRLRRSASIKDS
ncbi:MAG: hypothetical protein IPM06_15430 [Rhizobiales bacterium]|nr:hypothetical protein [Hyphomicrobiales bacterium]